MYRSLNSVIGGVTEPVDLVKEAYATDEVKRESLFDSLKKEWEYKALMAAAIPVSFTLIILVFIGLQQYSSIISWQYDNNIVLHCFNHIITCMKLAVYSIY